MQGGRRRLKHTQKHTDEDKLIFCFIFKAALYKNNEEKTSQEIAGVLIPACFLIYDAADGL